MRVNKYNGGETRYKNYVARDIAKRDRIHDQIGLATVNRDLTYLRNQAA